MLVGHFLISDVSADESHIATSKPKFDPAINYGHALTVVSFMLAGAGACYGMRAELQSVDQRSLKGYAAGFPLGPFGL